MSPKDHGFITKLQKSVWTHPTAYALLATLAEMTGLEPKQVAETLGEKPLEKLTRGEQRRIAELLLDTVTVGLDEITMDIKTAGMEGLAGEAWNEDQN